MTKVTVAVLGACGWMGKLHSNIYQSMPRQFPDIKVNVDLKWLIGNSQNSVSEAAVKMGIAHFGTAWQDAVRDPQVDLIDICLPDDLHYEVAKAALLAKKHVYCEKPFTNKLEEARELRDLAASNGVITRVGHNFPINPVHRLAKEFISSGEIGEITMFKCEQHVDSLADPRAPHIWRLDGARAPTGIVGDTGSHVFSFIDYLIGEIIELTASCPVIHNARPIIKEAKYGNLSVAADDAEMRDVTNPDAGFVIMRAKSGAIGTASFSRIATGRRFVQRYEIYGTKGAIAYDYDQLTRLQLYKSSDPPAQQGFRAIDIGPADPDYARFLPLPNFGLGFNEIKATEISQVIRSIVEKKPAWPTFDDATRLVSIVGACLASSASKRWEPVN